MSTYKSMKKNKVKVIIAAILLIVVIALFFIWEMYGRDVVAYKEVIVLSNDIATGEEITANDIQTIRVADNSTLTNAIIDPAAIIGQSAAIDIPKGFVLLDSFFLGVDEITAGKEGFVFAIPAEWIYSIPQTIRRGDIISIFTVYPVTGNSATDVTPLQEPSVSSKPFLNVPVVYVKDSANTEIRDIDNNERINATGVVTNVEVFITAAEYEKMISAIVDGAKFNIVY